LTLALARFAKRVVAVDQSPAMLKLVQRRARDAGLGARVRTVEGDLENLDLQDGSVDAVFLSQALHHAARPPAAVREAARILKADGLLVVLDLMKHDRDWVRERWADQWLGFEPEEVRDWMREAGVAPLCAGPLPAQAPGMPVLIAAGRKRNGRGKRTETAE